LLLDDPASVRQSFKVAIALQYTMLHCDIAEIGPEWSANCMKYGQLVACHWQICWILLFIAVSAPMKSPESARQQ
jgi:hypothetical protein